MEKIKNVIRDIIKSANNDGDYKDIHPNTYSYEEYEKVLKYLERFHCDKRTALNLVFYMKDTSYKDLKNRAVDLLLDVAPDEGYEALYYLMDDDPLKALEKCKRTLSNRTCSITKAKACISIAKRIIKNFLDTCENIA